jgi:flagellin
MIIRHNMSSLNTSNKLSSNTASKAKSQGKLSSGLRINKASDDSAGLTISEKMRAQIRGLAQASRNVQDGISFLQVADAGLGNIISPHLQRMRELVIQAENDTYTSQDKQAIQDEIEQLKKAIDSIATQTNFNGIKMLDRTSHPEFLIGPGAPPLPFDYANVLSNSPVGTNGSLQFKTNLGYPTSNVDDNQILVYGNGSTSVPSVKIDGAVFSLNSYYFAANPSPVNIIPTVQNGNSFDTVYQITSMNIEVIQSVQIVQDKYEIQYTVKNNSSAAHDIGLLFNVDAKLGNDDNAPFIVNGSTITNATEYVGTGVPSSFTLYNQNNIGNGNPEIQAAGILTGPGIIENPSRFVIGNYSSVRDWDWAPSGAVGDSGYSVIWDPRNISSGGTFSVNTFYGQSIPPTIQDPTTTPESSIIYQMKLQVGANAGNGFPIKLVDAKSTFIGVNNINVVNPSSIANALSKIDSAIKLVSDWRSDYGANQNALEHIGSNLLNGEENLTSAESRIRDVDIAKEMVVFQKENILSQAATLMLAQANQETQGVLQLLR